MVVGAGMGSALGWGSTNDNISGLSFPFGEVVFVVLFAAVLALIAACYPARRAARLNVLDAIHTKQPARTNQREATRATQPDRNNSREMAGAASTWTRGLGAAPSRRAVRRATTPRG